MNLPRTGVLLLVALLSGVVSVHGVLNGDPAPAEVGAWFVHYKYLCYSSYVNTTYWLQCGGSLISPTTVLTAAHCLYNPLWIEHGPSSIRRIDLSIGHGARAQNFTVVNPRDGVDVVGHPNFWETVWAEPYTQKTTNHDIAIIRLPRAVHDVTPISVDLGQRVQLAGRSLWVSMEWNSLAGSPTVLGFGEVTASGDFSDVLRIGSVGLVSSRNTNCNFESGWHGEVSPGMLCTVPGPKGQLSGHGDSGGPLAVLGADPGLDVQIGIVSFGKPGTTDPAISTRVSEYTDFFQKHVPDMQRSDPWQIASLSRCEDNTTGSTGVGVWALVLTSGACLVLGAVAGGLYVRRTQSRAAVCLAEVAMPPVPPVYSEVTVHPDQVSVEQEDSDRLTESHGALIS